MRQYAYIYTASHVTRAYITSEVSGVYGYIVVRDIKEADVVVYTESEHIFPRGADIMGRPCISIEELRR